MTRALSIVLHTHMPYVEGFGTWPFGEEWLWEAIATSYLPLLDVLDEQPGRVTVSLTPVLADQLAAPGVAERCLAFLREVRPESHRLDVELAGDPARPPRWRPPPPPTPRPRMRSRRAAGTSCGAFAPHAAWTSAATHAVLPLLATEAGVRLQLETGIASHRARFGDWGGGLWLPECAHAPWLDAALEEAGVHATCVDWTGRAPALAAVPLAGRAAAGADRPRGASTSSGAPAATRRAAPTATRTGSRRTATRPGRWTAAAYDPARAAAQARADAEDFVARAGERLAGGGLCVCALDTELLGHFWHEGVTWLRAVLAACEAHGLPLAAARRRAGRARAGAAPAGMPATSWGAGARPAHVERAAGRRARVAQRAAELAVLGGGRAPPRSARCASCWRCRPPTGRSRWPARPRASTRASARRATGGRSRRRSRGRRRSPRCASSRRASRLALSSRELQAAALRDVRSGGRV